MISTFCRIAWNLTENLLYVWNVSYAGRFFPYFLPIKGYMIKLKNESTKKEKFSFFVMLLNTINQCIFFKILDFIFCRMKLLEGKFYRCFMIMNSSMIMLDYNIYFSTFHTKIRIPKNIDHIQVAEKTKKIPFLIRGFVLKFVFKYIKLV